MIAEKPRKIKVFQRRASKKGIRFRVRPVMTTSIRFHSVLPRNARRCGNQQHIQQLPVYPRTPLTRTIWSDSPEVREMYYTTKSEKKQELFEKFRKETYTLSKKRPASVRKMSGGERYPATHPRTGKPSIGKLQ